MGQPEATTPTSFKNQKPKCFQAKFPVQNDLKMLKVRISAHKDEALVLEAFINNLGLQKTMFPEGKAPKVCLGNSDMVTPVAEVEFFALKDVQETAPGGKSQP